MLLYELLTFSFPCSRNCRCLSLKYVYYLLPFSLINLPVYQLKIMGWQHFQKTRQGLQSMYSVERAIHTHSLSLTHTHTTPTPTPTCIHTHIVSNPGSKVIKTNNNTIKKAQNQIPYNSILNFHLHHKQMES